MIDQRKVAVEFREVNYQVQQRYLLSNLNLAIYQGEIVIFLGRSGSGKTTTLKLINRLLTPTEGKIIVRDRPTTDWDTIQLRRSIGYVIQEIGLFPHLNIADNVGIVPSLEGWKSNRLKARVYELLHLVGLEPEKFANRYPHQLSGGQRQRIGVARALAADPPILLMDEPFGALDPITRLELQQQLKSLQRQLDKTIVFVTHDIQEAFIIGSRIGLMEDGKLVSLGTPAEFKQDPHPETQRFLACLPLL
jgi:osmoprotectant transport system ATP-binding protein